MPGLDKRVIWWQWWGQTGEEPTGVSSQPPWKHGESRKTIFLVNLVIKRDELGREGVICGSAAEEGACSGLRMWCEGEADQNSRSLLSNHTGPFFEKDARTWLESGVGKLKLTFPYLSNLCVSSPSVTEYHNNYCIFHYTQRHTNLSILVFSGGTLTWWKMPSVRQTTSPHRAHSRGPISLLAHSWLVHRKPL